MLYIQFQLGEEYFAIATDEIIEIVPMVSLHPLSGSPPYFAGVFDYRGQIIPVLDLSKLITDKPSQPILSTRIALVRYLVSEKNHIVGLMSEKMTDMIEIPCKDLQETGFTSEKIGYLGPIANYKGTLIQSIKVNNLLNETLKAKLFIDPPNAK